MATTTYAQNYTASQHNTFRQSLAVAMCEAARAIQSEDPTGLSLPAGYNKGADDAEKKQNLHEERVTLANDVLQNPTGTAVWYSISAAEFMDVYEATDIIFMASDDSGAENSDYQTAVTSLWNAWCVTENDLT